MERATTSDEDRSFAKAFYDNADIDAGFIVQWVEMNFRPEEVYLIDELKQYIRENYCPDDIFDDDELEEWAENAGYVYPDIPEPDEREL